MARNTTWPEVSQELLALSSFHAKCSLNMASQLTNHGHEMTAEVVSLTQQSIMKHREWSQLLHKLSSIQS